MTLDETKQNANSLGVQLEQDIKKHAYVGVDQKGQVDYLAVIAALSRLMQHTLRQVPQPIRGNMADTAIATIEMVKRDGDERHVRKQ